MKKRLTCDVKYFCLGACLIFVGSVLLCVLGFAIVLPHETTRHWPQVTCYVVNSSYTSRMCSCDNQVRADSGINGCFESYPCLQIAVSYQVKLTHHQAGNINKKLLKDHYNILNGIKPNDEGRHMYVITEPRDDNYRTRDMLNQTVIGKLYRSWEDEFFKTCALHECGDEHWNIKQVETFQRLWGTPGASFPCYYDPNDVIQVILKRTSTSQMIHALLWPTIFLVSGVLIWLGLWVGCWEVDMEKYSQPSIDRTRGASSGRAGPAGRKI